ncbi:hypothetical protein TNIN_430161 [Trichonephila inaurata madagascariensis]|uniref:BTB domain-containing protein n=1 Tax=Trichonephila inaurata madagascariensis TaxID=2747483 RepID=A0A8X7CCI8_9ARAC|nr:hypothetical protein TNIN_430161 [Trichonephila inaurata madagascariensis]
MEIEMKLTLCRSDIICDERGLFVWRESLNSELSVVCGCKDKPYIPDFIEIHRNCIIGDILLTDDLASDLLFAAHHYQLGQLKKVCGNHLKHNLNVNNVIGIISIGDLIDPGLKEFGLKFLSFKCKISEMEQTKEWKILEKYRQEFALEILTAVENLRKKDLQEMSKKLALT